MNINELSGPAVLCYFPASRLSHEYLITFQRGAVKAARVLFVLSTVLLYDVNGFKKIILC